MGGAKLDKIDLINQALESADYLLIGGALAFTFLKAQGIPVGMSKVDSASLPLAKQLLKKHAKKIVLPIDFVVSESFSPKAQVSVVPFNRIGNHRVALDIGPDTVQKFWEHLQKAKLVVWNGPLGYFEWEKFSHGTREVGRLLGKVPEAVRLVGGGETVAAIHKFHLEHNFTHLSTGGGASLQFLSGKKLPGVMALEENWKKNFREWEKKDS
jgi:phosphoglycerate kinase